jgi:hypothetical protein
MLNCISSIGDLLWSSALTLAMAVKEVGALQGGAGTSGKCSNKAVSPKQATVACRRVVVSGGRMFVS